MALWMAYALAVSVLLAGSALAAEKGLSLYRKPTRWCWGVALVGSVAVPVLVYLASTGWTAGGAPEVAPVGTIETPGGGGVLPFPVPGTGLLSAAAPAGLEAELRALDPWLAGGCLAVSLAAAVWLAAGWLRLRSERREWQNVTVGDLTVWISPDEGPAVTGFFRGAILLPAWFEELEGELQRLVLRHEREHLTSGDHRLFGLGLAAVVLFAWNPVLWWCLGRLRQAMEIDCDRRVVDRGVSPATYGELLVRARRRAGGSAFSVASLATNGSLLERRIRTLADSAPEARSVKAGVAVAVIALAVAAGGWLPAPSGPVSVTGAEPAAERMTRVRVVPPVPVAIGLDLRLYRKPGGDASGGSPEGIDVEAVRMAKRLAYGCAPYLTSGAADGGRSDGAAGGRGCLVVMDGRRVEPSALRELGPGAIERIDILPAEAATERYGRDGRGGAFLIRTDQG